MRLAKNSLLDLARLEDVLSGESRIHHLHSLHSDEVVLPPLVIGGAMLSYLNVREGPGEISWRAGSFECMAPATFVLRNAIVHSSAGIIGIDEYVLAETLAHTNPIEHNYESGDLSINIRSNRLTRLGGTHVTVLAGSKSNYFHSLIESAARLFAVPDHILHEAQTVMFPGGAVCQPELFSFLPLPGSIRMRPVRDDETFYVERLVFPFTVHGQSSFHPCVKTFFDCLSRKVPDGRSTLPELIYIDRRRSYQRRLENEEELVSTLQDMGFVPVLLETLSLADQIRLFRGATFIVSAHGAGLTNIGFAQPDCHLLELHMDAYVNWVYRHLSALCEVRYDCVIGRALCPWLDVSSAAVHGMTWRISVEHVRAAISHMLER